ncbi:hypothetical protein P152DRAFT_430776 [Eremomyces bilateralis CBS 781.70]|uniref:Cell division control protein n=1 Tax=Eremomyces bilateralis CBS 781.70 TaxID=1392243 RepID=A0A6G1G9N6_9PEZI|nr:uncharacterized protein P152DRAFT_430776 [Eremomyces bilateralis CBS 781.70]KAF1814795.1 hypothetical protein P152DRAFT_430776 [Eremomyces bilateralis CBS 781.70]
MPGVATSEPPSVSLSFANNFWGKDDAGVVPLLGRMQNAKTTMDELKSFYSARAALEEEYARKLLSLARKPLGSMEEGTLRMSLDIVRGEIEATGKAHHNIASKMKTELDEPLAAFGGAVKERRKIVQGAIEKLLKVKVQQTIAVNKSRDRYEQESLKIKGYLAQGHMVMGQEERKNKAKLEKTQIQLSTTSNEYEASVNILEETTGRWNRDWKAACDKFQDLEEERLDFLKSSLWTFANIASTVCVSDDASCEKIRLSLEDCEVEKDIASFIKESGTGQEIPDPPKFIDFCRGDVDDASELAEEDEYSVANFQRTINPAFRSSSPQPSVLESHHDPNSSLARYFGHDSAQARDPTPERTQPQMPQSAMRVNSRGQAIDVNQFGDIPKIPHNEYPPDGMTQFCRSGPTGSDLSSARPSSRDSHSDYSNPTSFSSFEPSSGAQSPVKQLNQLNQAPPSQSQAVQKKKSGFFHSDKPSFFNSPFGRRNKENQKQETPRQPVTRSTWAPSSRTGRTPTPEPITPNTQKTQMAIGSNIFDVDASRSSRGAIATKSPQEDLDPIAAALAELKSVAGSKQASDRVSVDRYAGLQTPAPPGASGMTPTPRANKSDAHAAARGTPPPSYDPGSRLGAPQPAFTKRQMIGTTQKFVEQKGAMFNSAPNSAARPGSRGADIPRATSPAPMRATSPRPRYRNSRYGSPQNQSLSNSVGSNQGGPPRRSTSPNPYAMPPGGQSQRPRAQSSSPVKPREGYNSWGSQGRYSGAQPGPEHRSASPNPYAQRGQGGYGGSPGSRGGDGMEMTLSHGDTPAYGRGGMGGRPTSYYGGPSTAPPTQAVGRVRSKSMAEKRDYTREGRAILHYARAMYMYQAAIPEELSFAKGDVLAVLRLQDDGWWEAEVMGKNGRPGLVPSNYLQNC